MTIRFPACWTAENASEVLRTEALESSQAIFMAVHSPIRGFEIEGMQAGLVTEGNENGLLDALTGPNHRHLFCVIEGEPGSGKSHLIRWLRFGWQTRRPDDLVLMVPRSNGSLEGALRHMQERLPVPYQALFAGLGQVRDTSLRGRARDFHSKLANSLSEGYFASEAPMHAEWTAKYQLSRLIGHHQVLDRWAAPLRILETLSGGSDRNSRTESFSLRDVYDLVQLLKPLRDRSVGSYAMMAKRKFELDAERLKQLLDQGLQGETLREAASSSAPDLVRLLEALDARFNAVVQDLIGVGRDGLVRAFRQLRQRLAEERRRLVLLLEDITSFQGVDNQLLDVLVSKSETEENANFCDLLSVVGITTDFFNRAVRSYGNLRERITLHVRLGDATTGKVEDNLSLVDSRGRQSFIANYLRAIRAGVDEIERWHQVGHGEVPNACVGCVRQSVCHLAFGSTAQGVGFFPLSPQAIDRIYDALNDPQGTMSLRTPRGIVQNVLSPLLLHPERLENDLYPPSTLESAYLPPDERRLIGQIASVLDSTIDDEAERDRMRRFIAWWSSKTPGVRTERDEQGRVLFAGIPKEAYEAFGLQWLGEEEASQEVLSATPGAEPKSSPAPATTQAPDAPPVGAEKSPSESRKRAPSTSLATESKNSAASGAPQRSKIPSGTLNHLRAELPGWQAGEGVKDADRWSRLLMEILDVLPWRTMGVPRWLQHSLFTESTVMLEGTRRVSVRHFELPRHRWVREGLDAWITLRNKIDDDPEYARRCVARFLRRLMRLVRQHVDQRSLRAPDGEIWNPAGTAAQVLLARAWLQARIDTKKPLAEQWQDIFEPEIGNAESATNHTQGWLDVVHRVSHYRGQFLEMLRGWVLLTPSAGSDAHGVVDAGAIAQALVAMAERLEPDLPPAEPQLPAQLRLWEAIAEVGRTVRRILPQLPYHELNRVKQNLETLETACDGRSLPQYLKDVEQVVTALRELDPKMPHAVMQDWTLARKALEAKGLLDTSPGSPLQRLEDFLAEADSETRQKLDRATPIEQLAWVLASPTTAIAQVAEQIEVAQRAVRGMWNHASILLDEAGSESSDAPEALHAAGVRLQVAANQLISLASSSGGA